MRDAQLRHSVCGMVAFLTDASLNVSVTEVSSTVLVRFQACEFIRRGRQRACGCGKWGSGFQFISKAGDVSTPSHNGHVIFFHTILTVMTTGRQQDAISIIKLNFSTKRSLNHLHFFAEIQPAYTNTSVWQAKFDLKSNGA
jgi:hypothetical protein